MQSSHDRGWLSNTSFTAIVALLVGALTVAGGVFQSALTATPMKKLLALNSGTACVAVVVVAAWIILYRSWASHDDQAATALMMVVPTPAGTSTAIAPSESAPPPRDHAFLSVTRGTPPGGLTLDQRNVVNMFARTHGAHTLFVVAGNSTEAIAYANALADAFESGGWMVEGRAHDSARTVTRRMATQLPSEPDIAVSPDTGLGNDVRELLGRIGLQAGQWVPSLSTASSDVRIWIGTVPNTTSSN